ASNLIYATTPLYSKSSNSKIQKTSDNKRLREYSLEYWLSQINKLSFNQSSSSKKSLRNIRLKNERVRRFDGNLELLRKAFIDKIDENPAFYWSMYCDSELFNTFFAERIHAFVKFEGQPLWVNALRVKVRTDVSKTIAKYLDTDAWIALESRLSSSNFTSEDLDWAAWLLLFDSWLWCNGGYEDPDDSPFLQLCSIASEISDSRIKLAVCAYKTLHASAFPDVNFARLLADDDGSIRNILLSSGWKIPIQRPKRSK
ncbi:hypothetical protein, partial [Comamonas thiooxydans]|uniref:hypothetical protein n=1 Tax=Comamonas thiooxydans TaxID=363952 RepID=UPI0013F4518F